MVRVEVFAEPREVGRPDADGLLGLVDCFRVLAGVIGPVEGLAQICDLELEAMNACKDSGGGLLYRTLMLPAVSIVAFHWVIAHVLIGDEAGEHLHLAFFRQSKEAFCLVHGLLCEFRVDPLA